MLNELRRQCSRLGQVALGCLELAAKVVPVRSAFPQESPEGANYWSCDMDPAHPRPVVLVHGTWADMAMTWKTLAPALRDEGYSVFALNYGTRQPGTGHNLFDLVGGSTIEQSARDLAVFVDRVRATTGADQIDLVCHSQGALVAREYLKSAGGANPENPSENTVHTLVSLAGTNQGTSFNLNQQIGAVAQMLGIPVVELAAATVGPSYVQQMAGSPFLRKLSAGGDTLPGINYVALATRQDNMVTPPERSFLTAGPGALVKNIWVQDGCEHATADHMEVTSSPRSIWITLSALDPHYAATHPAPCP